MRYRFGDIVTVGLQEAIVIRVEKKRKWTYYDVIFEDYETTSNDWQDNLLPYETFREDALQSHDIIQEESI